MQSVTQSAAPTDPDVTLLWDMFMDQLIGGMTVAVGWAIEELIARLDAITGRSDPDGERHGRTDG